MEKSVAVAQEAEIDMKTVWEVAEKYDDATDPFAEGHERPELRLEHDLQMALALCSSAPKVFDIRPLDNTDEDPKKTATELAQRVLEAHASSDASATTEACTQLRRFLLQHRVELEV